MNAIMNAIGAALFPLLDGMAQPRIPKKGLARMNRSTD
jgi:hypothetical protein